jgi:hypothetical protein
MFLFAGLYRFTHAVLNKKEVSERFAITKMSWAESFSHLLKQTTSQTQTYLLRSVEQFPSSILDDNFQSWSLDEIFRVQSSKYSDF